jgi:UDP-N-acetylmuramoyl-tripeptide--D-alanyl-D-alanine ligase
MARYIRIADIVKDLLPARFHSGLESLIWTLKKKTVYYAAMLWRRCLTRTTFIAVAGSFGKTTTKDCIYAILSDFFPVARSLRSENNYYGAPRTILRVRPRHRYAVIEMATDRPGNIGKIAGLVRPHIGVLLSVGRAHTNNYRDLDAIAEEKKALIEALPKDGVAVLNADDPRVASAASRCGSAIRYFSTSGDADISAQEIRSTWPDRLSLRVKHGSETCTVNTGLVGKHWANAVLAALLVAAECNIGLKEAAASLEKVVSHSARLLPSAHPSGAVFLRDESNASLDALEKALDVLREGMADRKILVISNVTNHPSKRTRERLSDLGALAAGAADIAVFVNKYGRYARKAAIEHGMDANAVFLFTEFRQASTFLKENLRSGDLVLLKGRKSDHMERVYLSQFGEIGCVKKSCNLRRCCDFCGELKGNKN